MTRVRRTSRGFALVGVLILLLAVAALSLALVERTSPEIVQVAQMEQADRLRYALEAATRHAQWSLANNRSCAGYRPLDAMSFDGFDYATAISPTSGSPVEIDVTVTADNGDRQQQRLSRVRSYAATETLVIVSTPDDKDAEIEGASGKEDHNHADRDDLEINASGGDDDRVLMQLAVPEFQSTLRVESAVLTLYVDKHDGDVTTVQVRRITRTWDEMDVNWRRRDAGILGFDPEWDTPGGDATDSGFAEFTVSQPGYVDVDVTDIVQSWAAGSDNHGFLFQAVADGRGGKVTLVTGQNNDEILRPVLAIDYACECGASCQPTTNAAAGAVLSFADQVSVPPASYEHGDLFDLDPGTAQSVLVLQGSRWFSPPSTVVDAAHQLGPDRFLLSTADSVTLDGQTFGRDDVFELDTTDGSAKPFWTDAAFTPAMSIDAIALRADGRLAFSVSEPGSLFGMPVEPHDILLYNPAVSGVATWLEGEDFIAGASANVDALHVFDNGLIALSTDSNESVRAAALTSDDLVLYDPVSDAAEAFFTNGPVVPATASGRLNATTFLLASDPTLGQTLAEAAAGGRDCEASYRDNFLFSDYTRNVGTVDFTGPWQEIGESDGPTRGNVRIATDQGDSRLRLRDNDRGLRRTADLTIANRAILEFEYRRAGLDNDSDYVTLDVSTDGGSNWTELQRLAGPNNDSSYQTVTVDLTGYRSIITQVRFATSGALGFFDTVYIDDVRINLSGCP
ncbi:MAG: DNRLRE domain-containing protein [Pseudomonadota bacterium]